MSTLRDRIAEIIKAQYNWGDQMWRFNAANAILALPEIAAEVERQGEEPQFDKNRGYTEPQVNEGACDVCDMRWTGYGTQCPVCEGER